MNRRIFLTRSIGPRREYGLKVNNHLKRGLPDNMKISKIDKIEGIPFLVPIKKFADVYTGFSLIAKLYLAASMKIHPLASEFTELSLLEENILQHELKIVDGCLEVANSPGFGVALDETILEKVRLSYQGRYPF